MFVLCSESSQKQTTRRINTGGFRGMLRLVCRVQKILRDPFVVFPKGGVDRLMFVFRDPTPLHTKALRVCFTIGIDQYDCRKGLWLST